MPVRSISKGGSEGMKKKNPCKRPLAALLALLCIGAAELAACRCCGSRALPVLPINL